MDGREQKEIEEKIEELIRAIGLDPTKPCGCRGDPENGYAPRVPLDEVSEKIIREARPELIGEFYGIPAMNGDEYRGCHAFNHETEECSVHEMQPLYCRLYPFRVGALSTVAQYGGPGSFTGQLAVELQRCGTFDPNNLSRKERHRLEREALEILEHYPVFVERMKTLFRENSELFERHKIR